MKKRFLLLFLLVQMSMMSLVNAMQGTIKKTSIDVIIDDREDFCEVIMDVITSGRVVKSITFTNFERTALPFEICYIDSLKFIDVTELHTLLDKSILLLVKLHKKGVNVRANRNCLRRMVRAQGGQEILNVLEGLETIKEETAQELKEAEDAEESSH